MGKSGLLHKREDPSSNPWHPCGKLLLQYLLGEWRWGESWSLLTTNQLQASPSVCFEK